MIVWRDKFIATGVHFLATLLLAAIAAGVIFLLWYPAPFHTMIGGSELFMLVVGCDLALGPLMSLVIYDRTKSRRHLLVDYSIVGVIQVAALIYGVTIMSDARPVYVAFSTDRFEVVLAGDIRKEELEAARDPAYRRISWTGPRFIAIDVPPEDKQDALFQALSGNEEHQRPKFYVPFETALDTIRARAKPLSQLEQRKPESQELVADALRGVTVPATRLAWLPIRHFRGFWTAIIDTENGLPVAYVDLDPY